MHMLCGNMHEASATMFLPCPEHKAPGRKYTTRVENNQKESKDHLPFSETFIGVVTWASTVWLAICSSAEGGKRRYGVQWEPELSADRTVNFACSWHEMCNECGNISTGNRCIYMYIQRCGVWVRVCSVGISFVACPCWPEAFGGFHRHF